MSATWGKSVSHKRSKGGMHLKQAANCLERKLNSKHWSLKKSFTGSLTVVDQYTASTVEVRRYTVLHRILRLYRSPQNTEVIPFSTEY